jgi:hypothetical protein
MRSRGYLKNDLHRKGVAAEGLKVAIELASF